MGDVLKSFQAAANPDKAKQLRERGPLSKDDALSRVTLDVPIGVNSFARDFSLLPSFLVRACLEARLARGNLFAGMVLSNNMGFVVRSQVVQMHHDLRFSYELLHQTPKLRIEQELVKVGSSSFEYSYEITLVTGQNEAAPKRIATLSVKLVCVRGGKAAKIPLQLDFSLDPVPAERDLCDRFRAVLDSRFPLAPQEPLRAPMSSASNPVLVYDVTVRYQDEDINGHTNHASYFRFFEDALRTLQAQLGAARAGSAPPLMAVEYARETFVGQRCQILVSRIGPDDLAMLMLAPDGVTVVSRCWVQGADLAGSGGLTSSL